MADKGWLREFDDPIEIPDGTRLNTLREAIGYRAKAIPKPDRNMPAVTTSAEMLTYAAEREIAWMFMARMAVLKAIQRSGSSILIEKTHIGAAESSRGTNENQFLCRASNTCSASSIEHTF
jgi:hypothetical protein